MVDTDAVVSPMVQLLERLLALPAANLRVALSEASDIVAGAFQVDKVDAFLYDETRDSLVALGVSNQPLSAVERQHGLDVLPLSNGGRAVHVFVTGQTFVTGRLQEDPEELRGVKEALGVRSLLGVALQVGERRRGLMLLASQRPDHFTAEHTRIAEAMARWMGLVLHRAELVEEIARNAVERGRQAVAEELVTVLAHDLRNYIAPVEMRLGLVRRRAEREGRDADLRDVQLSLRGIERLSGMISDILDVARIDEGVLAMNVEPVDLGALLDDLTTTLSTPEHAIQLKVSEPVTAAADPRRIRQCLENVLANALKHSPRGAPVTVLVRRERRDGDERGRVEIIDQGPGIAPELLPHIFERFVTGDPRLGGTGLGLYLAHRIAGMHRGELRVSSTPGAGTSFILTVPAYQERAVALASGDR